MIMEVVGWRVCMVQDVKTTIGCLVKRQDLEGLSELISWITKRGESEEEQAWMNEALCEASRGGWLEGVAALVPVSDPKAEDSEALRWAAQNGHVDCVRMMRRDCMFCWLCGQASSSQSHVSILYTHASLNVML